MNPEVTKIVKVIIKENASRYAVSQPIYKEDYGLHLLLIEGIDLPEAYEVDFSSSETHGTSVTMIGNADGVLIPKQFIDTGKDIFAFLYITGEDFGRTVYKFRIPNRFRPDRTDIAPDEEDQATIDSLVSALNTAVETVFNETERAENIINTAMEATAADAEQTASDAARAEAARDRAETAASSAEASATSAAQSEANAAQSESTASAAATSASASAASAYADAERAEQAAAQSGYMHFYINNEGDLIYQRTSNVNVDFYLDNDGDLHVRANG